MTTFFLCLKYRHSLVSRSIVNQFEKLSWLEGSTTNRQDADLDAERPKGEVQGCTSSTATTNARSAPRKGDERSEETISPGEPLIKQGHQRRPFLVSEVHLPKQLLVTRMPV